MANILLANGNIECSIEILNTLYKNNTDIKIVGITKTGFETLDKINSEQNIDAILLDDNFKDFSGSAILKSISDKYKYSKSCIFITENETDIKNNEKLMDEGIIHSILSTKTSIEERINTLNTLLTTTRTHSRELEILRKSIKEEVKSINYDMSYKGTHYLITAIELIISNPEKNITKLETELYPLVGEYYNNSVHNVKCNINRATTMMYYNCKQEVLENYVGTALADKPKTRTIINAIIDKISK